MKVLLLLLLTGVVYSQQAVVYDYKEALKHLPTSTEVAKFNFTSKLNFNFSTNKGFAIEVDSSGYIQIIYEKDTKVGESVKEFFKWFIQYYKQNYYLIRKEDMDKLLENKQ